MDYSIPASAREQAKRPHRHAAQDAALANLKFQRSVKKLIGLGARPVLEMLGRDHGIEDELAAKVDRYASRLTPEMVARNRADRMVASGTHVVGGAR